MHKHSNVKHRLRSQMVDLNPIVIKKTLGKIAHWESQAKLQERGKQNNLRITSRWENLPYGIPLVDHILWQ